MCSSDLTNTSSPGHSGGVTPMSQRSSTQPGQRSVSFQGQPQNPTPGSHQDRGVGNVSQAYDGVNGPVAVSSANIQSQRPTPVLCSSQTASTDRQCRFSYVALPTLPTINRPCSASRDRSCICMMDVSAVMNHHVLQSR